jgi:predicted acetyltransferase
MEYRFCRDEEFPALRQLWVQCFGDEEPWTSWYFSHHYKAEHTWVGIKDGIVVAQAHLLPHRQFLRGAWRDTVYFVGVCVNETLRGCGYGRDIMATALAELQRTGVSISILQPRWPDFYRPLGWDYCYSRRFYHLPLAVAEVLLETPPAPGLTWIADAGELDELSRLYERFVQPRHGYVCRNPLDWGRMLADHRGDGGRVGLLLDGAQPAGYVLYKMADDLLRVREMIWRDQTGLDSLWKLLLEQARTSGINRLEWEDPAEDPASAMFVASHSEPFLMGRLTDCQSVLTAMPYPDWLTANLAVELVDPIAPWNAGRFRWRISQGSGSWSAEAPIGEPDLVLNVALLSQLYFGQRPAAELFKAAEGFRAGERERDLLAAIFLACRNFISEYF